MARRTRFFEFPPPPDFATAVAFKRASLFPIECQTPDPNISDVDFVWTHADFFSKIDLGMYLNETSRCATENMRWVLADRLVRPIGDAEQLNDIASRTRRIKSLIKSKGSNPNVYICSDPSIDDDFVSTCHKLDAVAETLAALKRWAQNDDLGVLTRSYEWPNWIDMIDSPVTESIDAQITVLCDVDVDDIVLHETEFVVRIQKPGWVPFGPYWTCQRLRELNERRKKHVRETKRRFEIEFHKHETDVRAVCRALVELDEACFYAAYDYDHPTFCDEIVCATKMSPIEIARAVYLAQCGFPVPLSSTNIFKWFTVSDPIPNDGIFKASEWAACVDKMREKWGEPFVL